MPHRLPPDFGRYAPSDWGHEGYLDATHRRTPQLLRRQDIGAGQGRGLLVSRSNALTPAIRCRGPNSRRQLGRAIA